MSNNLQKSNERILNTHTNLLYKITKRIFDIFFSIFILILLSPLLIIIFLLIGIIKEKNETIIFKQLRTGLHGKQFYIYKFRTMRNLEKKSYNKNSYNWENGVPDDFVFKSASTYNPNITKIGGFMRKYSIDELPQFFNVLYGNMSVIGPRPEIIEIANCYDENQQKRLRVKPGITGWAQINGRSNSTHGEKIYYDLYYINNQGLLLDFKILYKTIFKSVFGNGAF